MDRLNTWLHSGSSYDKTNMFAAFKNIFKTTFVHPVSTFHDPPAPYEDDLRGDQDAGVVQPESADSDEELIRRSIANLDLLSPCHFHSEPHYEELEDRRLTTERSSDMGQKVSLTSPKHRSKVSLTWVLREHSAVQYNQCRNQDSSENGTTVSRKYNDRDDYNNGDRRVVGRSDRRFDRVKTNQSHERKDCWSTDDHSSRRRRRRKKKPVDHYFGYEIKDIDNFLAQATIDKPGNIPVVLTSPSILYQTQTCLQKEIQLSLGMVVNAVFKNQKWLYVQTPHGEEGYILYSTCLPLGILPPLQSSHYAWKNSPCWESTLDIYPRPCGNMTDNEKEKLRGGTKSECGRAAKPKYKIQCDSMSMCGERSFDKLYLKAATSCPKLREIYEDKSKNQYEHRKKIYPRTSHTNRHTLLIIEENYEAPAGTNFLSVKKGDVVISLEGETKIHKNSDQFYVRNKDGVEGYIPVSVAGYGFL